MAAVFLSAVAIVGLGLVVAKFIGAVSNLQEPTPVRRRDPRRDWSN